MGPTYLDVPFKEKDEAKALGARWDAVARRWYVPEGRALAPFGTWLPTNATAGSVARSLLEPAAESYGREISLPRKGIPLSLLLAGVAQAVAETFASGVWTFVEVVEARTRNGHVYLDVSERTPDGAVLAAARATLWASAASRILPEFERATGASIAPGIKLLVRARPVFKPQYGFSLDIDAIDPEYTLGDLEARKREIRTRLQQEGIYDANRKLAPPWDFNAVLVLAPPGAAGLGDFQAEADRLERFGLCRFVYAFSRFQGEGAAREIGDALLAALATWELTGAAGPDAVVIIRGGGAVNDLAWLNDHELARAVCTLKIPVLTGIGHERDSTILDEVANLRFDTPSKVAAGIEQTIRRRVEEARASFDFLSSQAMQAVQSARGGVERGLASIQAGAIRALGEARRSSADLAAELRLAATRSLHAARQEARSLVAEVKYEARRSVSVARLAVPSLYGEIRAEAGNALSAARTLASARLDNVRDRASLDVSRSRESTAQAMQTVVASARRTVADGRGKALALVREIAGQGPEKTLARGFAIVRDEGGKPVTSADATGPGERLEIEFRDGRVAVRVK